MCFFYNFQCFTRVSFSGDYLTPCEAAQSCTIAYCIINNISTDRSTMGMCHLQIKRFIISVTSPLIRLSDFYDRNFLHGAVFTDKGRTVSAGFDLILLNADKDTSLLTACNLIYSRPSFLQSTFSCLQFLIHI